MADTLIRGTTIIEDKRVGSGTIWSIPGVAFTTRQPQTDAVVKDTLTGFIRADTDNIELMVSVNLPQGVTVTKVIVYGNAGAIAGITWTLFRVDRIGGTSVTMATAAVGTEDTSIGDAIIDNSGFSYMIAMGVNEFDNTDEIYGARIVFE